MIDHDIFKALTPEDHCSAFAYTVTSLARIGLLAAENDSSGVISDVQRFADLSTLFQIIDAMTAVVIDGIEHHERKLKHGIWAEKEAIHETA